MKIPRRIRVDGEDWTIEKHSNGMDSSFLGRTFKHDHLITLNKDAKGIESTLLHEIVHAIDMNRNLELTESQVSSLSSGLYAVIVDNNLDFRRGK